MTQIGRVTKIEGSRVTLVVQSSPVCAGCGSRLCGARGREFGARNSRGLSLKAGDFAEISFPASGALKAAMRVFGLPVLGFAVFYFIFGYIFEIRGELPRALFSFAGFGVCAVFAFVWGRRFAELPGVVRVVDAEEAARFAAGGGKDAGQPEGCPERAAG